MLNCSLVALSVVQGDAPPTLHADVFGLSTGNKAAYGPLLATPTTQLAVANSSQARPPVPPGQQVRPAIYIVLLDRCACHLFNPLQLGPCRASDRARHVQTLGL